MHYSFTSLMARYIWSTEWRHDFIVPASGSGACDSFMWGTLKNTDINIYHQDGVIHAIAISCTYVNGNGYHCFQSYMWYQNEVDLLKVSIAFHNSLVTKWLGSSLHTQQVMSFNHPLASCFYLLNKYKSHLILLGEWFAFLTRVICSL